MKIAAIKANERNASLLNRALRSSRSALENQSGSVASASFRKLNIPPKIASNRQIPPVVANAINNFFL